MPLTRYQLRNEYSLADPELYRAADKDDPEALLEGVAMAGLVGVLRQLGDLAEFAAEIFHDLHEEVMATAARGHGLMIRVQQLEAEFPPIEKSILSQTSHSSFLYNAGIDWHSNLQMDQNLITRGDLPRFVMDSYEECRGPPRLFLLDKFDIAGAGACLKRYSDPSFFKVEFTSSEAKKPEIRREKRSRKIKKKALRWRNGETPEVFLTSHSKLHQLFLEEHRQVETNVSVQRVKLKRRHSSSLFDLKTGKSYMEKFLESRSPESKVVYETSISPPLLKMESSNSSELDPEIHEICTRSPSNELEQIDKSSVPFPNRQEKLLDSSTYELGEAGLLKKLTESTPENTPLTFYKVEDQKESVIDGESKTETSADGYRSDDVTSDMENYMDALATMESEMETDTESRPKNEQSIFNLEKKGVDSDSNEAQQEIQAQLSYTHCNENTIASDDGNNLVKKGRYSFSCSDSLSNLAENVQSDGGLAAEAPSTEICSAVMLEMTSGNISESGDIFRTRSLEHVVSSGTCNEECEIPSYTSEFREALCNSCVTDSTFAPSHLSPGATLSEVQLSGPDATEFSSDFPRDVIERSLSNAEDDGEKLGGDLPFKTDGSDIPAQSRDDLLPVGSHESQPVEILNGGNHDLFSDAFMHLPSILDLPQEAKNDDDAFKEMLCTKGAENSSTQNLINGKLDSPHSVTLPTEVQFHGSAEKDLEAPSGTISRPECLPDFPTHGDLKDVKADGIFVEIENGKPTAQKSKYMALVVDQPETGEVVEEKFLETNQVPPVELDSEDIGVVGSEMETVCNSLEVSSNMSDSEVKDGPAPGSVHLKSFSAERNSNVPLDFTSGCAIAVTPNHASELVACSQFADSATGNIHEETDDVDTIAIAGTSTGSPSEDSIRLQEECRSSNGDSDHDKSVITDDSYVKNVIGLDAQNEVENQPAVAPTFYDFELCNPQSDSLSGSELLNNVHDPLLVECTQNRLPPIDGIDILSPFEESDQESELKQPPQCHLSDSVEVTISPSTHSLPEVGAPSEQRLELQPDQLHGRAFHEAGESTITSDYQSEQTESSNHIGCDTFIAPSKFSSVDPLSQPSNARVLALADNHKVESSEPFLSPFHSTFPSLDLLPQATHQQPSDSLSHRPISDFSLHDHSALQTSLEEMPPLPPLPPIQWRIGKLRHGSLVSDEETIQPSFNPFSPFSPATADENDQQQSSNPFLPLPTTHNEMPQHSAGSEIMRPSGNPPISLVSSIEVDKIQHDFPTSDGEIAQPLNPFLPLPAIEDEESQHSSLTSEGTILQPSINPFVTPTIEDVNTEHASLAQQLDTVASIPNKEYENPQQTSTTLEGEVVHPPKSFTPTIENEKHLHHSLTLGGEVGSQSSSAAAIPTVEDGRANGTLKSWLSRPRDPLIEAVASHDKRMLRKVTERIRPQIGLKVDERDSLLEQIRSKSFSLKPAVVSRPSIQGPKTNLKVTAILEKANAIRQALAGSDDEDDDRDSWSDS